MKVLALKKNVMNVDFPDCRLNKQLPPIISAGGVGVEGCWAAITCPNVSMGNFCSPPLGRDGEEGGTLDLSLNPSIHSSSKEEREFI